MVECSKEMQKYVFRKYTPHYLEFFNSEKIRISKTLGPTAKIEHVGSTAVRNLGGKGIIDIAVGVLGSKKSLARKKLETSHYTFREKASCLERLFFRKDRRYRSKTRRIHIHLVTYDSCEWKKMVGFRNYLIVHPAAIKQYSVIKKTGVKKALGDGEIYRTHKERFIKNILKKIT